MKSYPPEQIRNVAVVGHGGSGKSMLVEHMLYTSGAIERVGAIDAGTTQSDFDELEQKRQISTSAVVLPLEWHGHKLNLIDVPGFPDFVGDLHGVARVADSMVIVCEAKRDIDVGFDLAWELAEREGIPRCIFINKLERDNADYEGLIETLHARYGNKVVNVQVPIGTQSSFSGVLDLLSMKVYKGKDRGEQVEAVPDDMNAQAEALREKMMDAAAEGDDALMEKYLGGEQLTPEEVEHGLMLGIKEGRVVPILLGSAASGLGVATLLDRIVGELPPPVYHDFTVGDKKMKEDPNGPLVGFVFKTTQDPYVGKLNYVRIFSGTLKVDDHVTNTQTGKDERVHNLYWPHGKNQEPAAEVGAGDICVVAKLQDTHTGNTLCGAKEKLAMAPVAFPDPIYRVAIKPVAKSDEDKLGGALEKILEEDPTLRYVRDTVVHQEILEGMGDIHLDNTIDKLRVRFGVNVTTEEAKVPYKETIRGSAKAQGRFKRQTGGRGQFGDCWLEVAPMGRGEGFSFENKVVGGSIPKNYIPAIEKGVVETMTGGFLAGYPVVDVKVTVYDGSYHDVDSSEAAFKTAARIGFKAAAGNAQPTILEPVLQLFVDVPDEAVGDVVGDLNTRRGHMQGMEPVAPGKTRVSATVPMATMQRYALDLRSITKGRGMFRTEFARYDELPAHEQQNLVKHYEEHKHDEDEH